MERHKMSREERAKQFMPFAALKGYPEALRKKEEEIERQRSEKGIEDPFDELYRNDGGEE